MAEVQEEPTSQPWQVPLEIDGERLAKAYRTVFGTPGHQTASQVMVLKDIAREGMLFVPGTDNAATQQVNTPGPSGECGTNTTFHRLGKRRMAEYIWHQVWASAQPREKKRNAKQQQHG